MGRTQVHPARRAILALVATVVAGSALYGFSATSGADVTSLVGSAFGYTSQVGLFGGPANVRPCANPPTNTVDCRPRPAVTLPAGGSATPLTDSVTSGDARYGPGIIFTSGPITVSTEGTTGPTGSVTSTASIERVNTSGVEVFTADAVTSTCTATEAATTGTTTITNGTLRISEGDPDVEGDDTVIPVPANPAPNTTFAGVIEGVGDAFTYVFNEQTTDPVTGTLTVSAGHQILEGPTAIGHLYFGRVVCGLTSTTSTTGTSTTTTTAPTTTTIAATTTTSGATTTTTSGATTTTTAAADTLDCDDFTFQEDAQAELERDPSDPHRLDQGGQPGVACESLPRRAGGQGTAVAGAAASAPGTLARTGADLRGQILLGAAFVVIGTAMVVRGRARRPGRG